MCAAETAYKVRIAPIENSSPTEEPAWLTDLPSMEKKGFMGTCEEQQRLSDEEKVLWESRQKTRLLGKNSSFPSRLPW